MNSFDINLYNDLILSIKRGNSIAGRSAAKPLFILSILECIALEYLGENKIMFNDNNLKDIYNAFARYYNETSLTWRKENRPPYNGKTPSEKYLKENLLYAKLDDELWELLQDAESREYIRKNIITRFLTKQ